MFKVIPAIDILDGNVVRLQQGDYGQVTQYNYTPVELAKHYVEQGAQRIHLVDLNGAKDGELVNEAVIRSIREAVDVELDLGGGIRNLATAKKLFELGLNELILGSLFVQNPAEAQDIIHTFPGMVSAGLDVKEGMIAIEGWESTTHISLYDMLNLISDLPLASLVYTDISKDGMMIGPNIEEIKKLARSTRHRIIASGGVRHNQDVAELKEIHPILIGCIVGKGVLAGQVTIAQND